MKKKITVTRRDIERGKKGSPNSCPVALAVKRLGHKNVGVGLCSISWSGMPVAIMSMTAQYFIERFDSGKPVKPFSFTVSV